MDTDKRPLRHYGPLASVLYHVCVFINAYDIQIIPVCMRAFEVSLYLSPSSLSIMVTAELICAMGVSPFWGLLADKYGCRHVESTAMLLNGLVCTLLGLASSYPYIVFLRILHGLGLGCTGPVIQKVITDSRPREAHGSFFGMYYAVNCLGRLASIFVTILLAMKNISGHYGWRLCYIVMGSVWLIMGVLIYFYMKPEDDNVEIGVAPDECSSWGVRILQCIKLMFKKRTYRILLLVIYATESFMSILIYTILYLQYSGLPNVLVGVAVAVLRFGGMTGGLLGGFAIDACHKMNKTYGRIMSGAVVISVRLLLVTLLLSWPIEGGELQWYYYIGFFMLGASLFTKESVDRPIISAVVPRESQATALSLTRVFGGMPGCAIFPSLFGYLAEKRFGYIKTSELIEDMALETRVTNADALRRSMMCLMIASSLFILFLYFGLFFIYPKDVEASNCSNRNHEV
ncbi:multiplied multi-transmembrane transporter-like protein [Babesia gibsoni]|uniref:Multiplied multi-transmembrane transporter-like protein n=1 Tax=Babesia gibsoni TaxID=33632 RepID=A0AAD8PEX2_BABGI|nr:multiplied multi-transmembrane transporter-like protein [Babesia gibsoni]